jgi:hypothetical protein
MPTPCSHPARPRHQRLAAPRRSPLRPWPVMPAIVQMQLGQQIARVLQRVRGGEVRRANRSE